MALDADNVRVARTGAVYSAPTTAVLPTDANTPVGVEFVDHGYLSEDGVTETTSRSTEPIRAWQNATIVREIPTEGDVTYAFTLIETTADNVSLFYGDAVDTANGSVRVRPMQVGDRRAFVIDVVDGTDYIRTVIPDGEVMERGEQVYASGQPVGYPVTIRGYQDENGVAAIKYHSALVVPVGP